MGIFKPGWFPDKIFNYSHPIKVREIKAIKKQQEEIQRSAIPDWEKLRKIQFTI
jgi:hypothetical protein